MSDLRSRFRQFEWDAFPNGHLHIYCLPCDWVAEIGGTSLSDIVDAVDSHRCEVTA